MKFTLDDICAEVAGVVDLKQQDVKSIAQVIFETIVAKVSELDEVRISKFGTFKTATRAEHKGTSPIDGKPILIPSSTFPKFTPSQTFKDYLK
jgi:nucleoid DNA-binding protein